MSCNLGDCPSDKEEKAPMLSSPSVLSSNPIPVPVCSKAILPLYNTSDGNQRSTHIIAHNLCGYLKECTPVPRCAPHICTYTSHYKDTHYRNALQGDAILGSMCIHTSLLPGHHPSPSLPTPTHNKHPQSLTHGLALQHSPVRNCRVSKTVRFKQNRRHVDKNGRIILQASHNSS